jgi:hypothetical protein
MGQSTNRHGDILRGDLHGCEANIARTQAQLSELQAELDGYLAERDELRVLLAAHEVVAGEVHAQENLNIAGAA